MPVVVQLAPYEIRMAVAVGTERAMQSIIGKIGDRHICRQDWERWGYDIEAAAAEVAVAKHLGMFFDGSVNTFKRSDLGTQWEVRHTRHPQGHLIIRREDPTYSTYILVVGLVPRMTVCGWIKGIDGKSPKHWCEMPPPAAWFVKQIDLYPIDTIETRGVTHE